MEGGRAQADALQRGGDAWANAIAGITGTFASGLNQYGQERKQQNTQEAVRRATSPAYPSATRPVPGTASDVPDPGAAHMEAILGRLSPEDRPLAVKGIQEIQSYAQKVQEHNLQVEELKGKLADAETKRKLVAGDYGAGLGKQITQWLGKPDGGLSAALFGLGNAKAIGTQGIDELEPVLQGLSQELEEARASGDPKAMQAAAEKNRQIIGPLALKLQANASPEWLEKNQPKTRTIKTRDALGNEVEQIVKDEPGQTFTSAPKLPADEFEAFVRTRYGPRPSAEQRLAAKQQWAAAGRDPNVAAARTDAATAREQTRLDTRADKSYQFNSAELERTAKPLTDQAERFGRLVETVNQRTPQADALIAPELLTVMAGGQGSGLRMNEAEIARIVGGRTAYESLKATLNKYSLDPSKGLSVTDAQREQIKALVGTMRDRIASKASALNEARQALIDADSVEEQRRVMARLKATLNDVGVGTSSAPGGAGAGTKKKNPFR